MGMNEPTFWEIIARVHSKSGGDMDRKCELVAKEIAGLSASDAEAFGDIFDLMDERAYTWPLWGGAYVIHGGCSDDTFDDSRASLISRGKQTFDKTLADPDSMADEDIDEELYFYEGFQYAISESVGKVLGKRAPRKRAFPDDPSGDEWEEDRVSDLYPRLAEKFG
jgi:hypothetical protein